MTELHECAGSVFTWTVKKRSNLAETQGAAADLRSTEKQFVTEFPVTHLQGEASCIEFSESRSRRGAHFHCYPRARNENQSSA